MSIPYPNIAKAVALRANQLKDAVDATALDTNFSGGLSANMDGMEVPYTALKLAVLGSEKRIVGLIGRCSLPILRRPLQGVTANIVSGAIVPQLSATNAEFFGTFSGVYDMGNNTPLTEKTKTEVLRRIRNTGGFYKLDQYIYAWDGLRLFHTRPSVYLEGVAWSLTAQTTAFDTFGNSPLPAELESFWVADVLANLPQENWFISESQVYLNLAQKGEQQLLQGVVPAITLPNNTAHADPIKE